MSQTDARPRDVVPEISDRAKIGAWLREEATHSLGQHDEAGCTALMFAAEHIEAGTDGQFKRSCDDCDFATNDPDCMVCPLCKGMVG